MKLFLKKILPLFITIIISCNSFCLSLHAMNNGEKQIPISLNFLYMQWFGEKVMPRLSYPSENNSFSYFGDEKEKTKITKKWRKKKNKKAKTVFADNEKMISKNEQIENTIKKRYQQQASQRWFNRLIVQHQKSSKNAEQNFFQSKYSKECAKLIVDCRTYLFITIHNLLSHDEEKSERRIHVIEKLNNLWIETNPLVSGVESNLYEVTARLFDCFVAMINIYWKIEIDSACKSKHFYDDVLFVTHKFQSAFVKNPTFATYCGLEEKTKTLFWCLHSFQEIRSVQSVTAMLDQLSLIIEYGILRHCEIFGNEDYFIVSEEKKSDYQIILRFLKSRGLESQCIASKKEYLDYICKVMRVIKKSLSVMYHFNDDINSGN